jgi:hypothetical protein
MPATMKKEGATLPESLPIEPLISEVRKWLADVEYLEEQRTRER